MKAVGEDYIEMKMTDQKGNSITRKITWKDCITCSVFARNETVKAYLHFFENSENCDIIYDESKETDKCIYADEFGKIETISQLQLSAKNNIDIQIILKG